MILVMKCIECGYSRTLTEKEAIYCIIKKSGVSRPEWDGYDYPDIWKNYRWNLGGFAFTSYKEGFKINGKLKTPFEVLEKLAELFPWVARKLSEP